MAEAEQGSIHSVQYLAKFVFALSMGSILSNIMGSKNRIYVCQSGACRSKGSDAALVEIEELAKLVGNCKVETTGCLGYCRQGPAVAVVTNNRSEEASYHVKVNTFRKSASVIKVATGREPPVENLPPETEMRLSAIRATKQREYFISTYQWNKALCGLAELSIDQPELRPEIKGILTKAGYPGLDISDLLLPSLVTKMPTSNIENYVPWNLHSIKVVSEHSAIFQFSTSNPKRGTPHPRGRSRMAEPITWHVTMLGEVCPNDEGPLPWIERDYTPISSALEWERGRCDILIKIYNFDGLLTRWLHTSTSQQLGSNGTRIWLSKPLRTLSVPSLAAEDDDDNFRPQSILLLLAGTGIVALPQIMAHRDPLKLLGIATPQYKRLQCPIDMIQSCREDDILLLPEIKEYCLEGLKPSLKFRGLRNYTLLITNKKKHQDHSGVVGQLRPSPFQGKYADMNSATEMMKDVSNAAIIGSRLNKNIVSDAIGKMDYPFRVVISGNDAFNTAAREFLGELEVPSKYVTVLSA